MTFHAQEVLVLVLVVAAAGDPDGNLVIGFAAGDFIVLFVYSCGGAYDEIVLMHIFFF